MNSYSVIHKTPSTAIYQSLRLGAGLSSKNADAVSKALPNTLFSVQVLHDGVPVGMGRVIGDSGCFYQVVDIAVLPQHQGKGLGKRIMSEIAEYIELHVPETAYVSLIADGAAKDLYLKYGFKLTAPSSVGMALTR